MPRRQSCTRQSRGGECLAIAPSQKGCFFMSPLSRATASFMSATGSPDNHSCGNQAGHSPAGAGNPLNKHFPTFRRKKKFQTRRLTCFQKFKLMNRKKLKRRGQIEAELKLRECIQRCLGGVATGHWVG